MRLRILAQLLFVCGLAWATASGAFAQTAGNGACKSFKAWVGHGKVNLVDFRKTTGGASSPFIFRLAYTTFQNVPSDGYFGRITRGKMTFSYPRRNSPEVPYDKNAPFLDRFTHGPAYGDTVDYQAREIACNSFEVHWKEPARGDTVTHVEDFGREQVLTNIANINREPIPTGFDPLDLTKRLDSPDLFPNGNPVMKKDFGWFNLVGTMRQDLVSQKVWENELHMLVFKGSK
jgi:hypothetical protein